MENKSDLVLIKMLDLLRELSSDNFKKNACFIVNGDNNIISSAVNGLPIGCEDNVDSRQERPKKYMYFEHAERNAIYHAAKIGIALKGTRIYATMFPCSDCARGIIQSGITKVIAPKPDIEHERWGEHFKASIEMLKEAGIDIQYVNKTIIPSKDDMVSIGIPNGEDISLSIEIVEKWMIYDVKEIDERVFFNSDESPFSMSKDDYLKTFKNKT